MMTTTLPAPGRRRPLHPSTMTSTTPPAPPDGDDDPTRARTHRAVSHLQRGQIHCRHRNTWITITAGPIHDSDHQHDIDIASPPPPPPRLSARPSPARWRRRQYRHPSTTMTTASTTGTMATTITRPLYSRTMVSTNIDGDDPTITTRVQRQDNSDDDRPSAITTPPPPHDDVDDDDPPTTTWTTATRSLPAPAPGRLVDNPSTPA
ncbi:hypothetical protein SCLCIDRAFT_1027954 [Scleroderma citrinum Foug A]|uniref:Uncharacterized protein n=1 Tax=Scleroderma citrinum Foug A TaxID=1036808 RepID=A0A0C2ZBU3_9AGAM|nr:hypothetical protein SCLCIDRAFT_1027954 [Scleroderma citrinum Foug A]